jgi:hypothetical protein
MLPLALFSSRASWPVVKGQPPLSRHRIGFVPQPSAFARDDHDLGVVHKAVAGADIARRGGPLRWQSLSSAAGGPARWRKSLRAAAVAAPTLSGPDGVTGGRLRWRIRIAA